MIKTEFAHVIRKFKKTLDWKKRKQLEKLCDKHRKNNGEFDILIPCSGGKDGLCRPSNSTVWNNPLAVTWSPLNIRYWQKNLASFIGQDLITSRTPDPTVTKKLTHQLQAYG